MSLVLSLSRSSAIKLNGLPCLFATDKEANKWLIFVGASLALMATSAIGVLARSVIANFISERGLRLMAGVIFIVIGARTLLR